MMTLLWLISSACDSVQCICAAILDGGGIEAADAVLFAFFMDTPVRRSFVQGVSFNRSVMLNVGRYTSI